MSKKPQLPSSLIANPGSNNNSGKNGAASQNKLEELDGVAVEMEEGDEMIQSEALTGVGSWASSQRD